MRWRRSVSALSEPAMRVLESPKKRVCVFCKWDTLARGRTLWRDPECPEAKLSGGHFGTGDILARYTGTMVISCLVNIVQGGGGMFYLVFGYMKIRQKRSIVSSALQLIVVLNAGGKYRLRPNVLPDLLFANVNVPTIEQPTSACILFGVAGKVGLCLRIPFFFLSSGTAEGEANLDIYLDFEVNERKRYSFSLFRNFFKDIAMFIWNVCRRRPFSFSSISRASTVRRSTHIRYIGPSNLPFTLACSPS